MVLLLILQSALTTKLVLCDHSEIYTPSNQTDYNVNQPITPGIAAILIFFGLVFTVFIGCWLKLFAEGCCELCKFVVGALKEQRNEREQVSKWTLNSNLNFTQISPNMNTGAVAVGLYPVQQANNAYPTQPPPARSDHLRELCFSEKLTFSQNGHPCQQLTNHRRIQALILEITEMICLIMNFKEIWYLIKVEYI